MISVSERAGGERAERVFNSGLLNGPTKRGRHLTVLIIILEAPGQRPSSYLEIRSTEFWDTTGLLDLPSRYVRLRKSSYLVTGVCMSLRLSKQSPDIIQKRLAVRGMAAALCFVLSSCATSPPPNSLEWDVIDGVVVIRPIADTVVTDMVASSPQPVAHDQTSARGSSPTRRADGSAYTGETKNGKMHGQGTWSQEGVSTYTGDFFDDKMNGQGNLVVFDSHSYVGFFTRGLPHGQGTYTWNDGRKFVGVTLEGKFSDGIYMTPDGTSYVGKIAPDYLAPFSIEKLHGVGDLRLPDGRRYVGDIGDDDKNGAMVDAAGNAVVGVLVFAQGQSVFTEQTPDLAKKRFSSYPVFETVDVRSIKYFSDVEVAALRAQHQATNDEAAAAVTRRAEEQKATQDAYCTSHMEEQLENLQELAEYVDAMKCEDSADHSFDGDTELTLENVVGALADTRQVNESNLGNTGHWVDEVRECAEEIDYEITRKMKDFTQRQSSKPDFWCEDPAAIAHMEQVFETFYEYEAHAKSVLKNALDYANQREAGGHAQMQANDDAHSARLNADFHRWQNGAFSNAQGVIDQLDAVSDRTARAMEAQKVFRPNGNVPETASGAPQYAPGVAEDAEARYRADKAKADQAREVENQKKQAAKAERARQVEAELAQYRRDREASKIEKQRQAAQRELDREAERERRCMPILARDPFDCLCIDLGPKAGANHCTK
jgi:hypothetical protein